NQFLGAGKGHPRSSLTSVLRRYARFSSTLPNIADRKKTQKDQRLGSRIPRRMLFAGRNHNRIASLQRVISAVRFGYAFTGKHVNAFFEIVVHVEASRRIASGRKIGRA